MGNEEILKKIWDELTTVHDPELGINLVELGLIYDVEADEEGRISIRMTLTSMGCPIGPMLQSSVRHAALRVEGVKEVSVQIVWSPPWDPREMASEEAQIQMGLL
jgi:metal-sulfur cluster biosynthetic enzyme